MIFKNSGDETDFSAALLMSLIGGLTAGNAILVGVNLKKKMDKTLTDTDKLKLIRNTNLLTNLTLVSTILSHYYLLNTKRIKPAAVLAGIPLGTVEELSMTLSDRILKYRATGGIFLAHQDGGNESLRIICKAWTKKRYLFLVLLDFLFKYGTSKSLDLFDGISKFGGISTPILSTDELRDISLGIQSINPWKKFNIENVDEGREEWHLTFPIVTKNRIYTSMYLETYDIVESVNNGMNMLTVTLFLRKYRVPYPLEFVSIKGEKKKSGKMTDPTQWYRSTVAKEKAITTKITGLRWSDSLLDFGLSIMVLLHRYYMMMEYSGYTWEQLIYLTYASHLDKSRGLGNGVNFTVFKNKKNNFDIPKTVMEAMGILLW